MAKVSQRFAIMRMGTRSAKCALPGNRVLEPDAKAIPNRDLCVLIEVTQKNKNLL